MGWSEVDAAHTPAAPYELLDDGFAPDPCRLLVIGCGSILRGDDAVGPVLIRHLFARGVPEGVRLVDGGTAGMDVAFGMRGAERVVIVDASRTGAAPGTVYRVPAEQLGQLPPIDGLHTHNFRWDHALSFSAWLLGPLQPTDITVFLIEAAQFEPGSELSPAVAQGMDVVIRRLEAEFLPPPAPVEVEITYSGYLHLPAALAAEYFPGDTCVASYDGGDLVLVPLVSAAHGGLVLKQRNPAGDRSLLVSEVFAFEPVAGTFETTWDAARGALRVRTAAADGDPDGDRGPDRGGGGERPVGRLPGGADPGGDPAPAAPGVLHPAAGEPGGGRDPEDRGAAPGATEQP